MMKVLRTKQEELEGDEFLSLILERDKCKAALKEEIATLKTTLKEKEQQLEVMVFRFPFSFHTHFSIPSQLHPLFHPITTTPTVPSHHNHAHFSIPSQPHPCFHPFTTTITSPSHHNHSYVLLSSTSKYIIL